MCGIVGYIGHKDAMEILLSGLEKLEYRGYDSAGIAWAKNGKLCVQKRQGKLNNLKNILAQEKNDSIHAGIGHTRWATHGKPSDENAHPHLSANGKFALVHNGIIENYVQLKETYLQDVVFSSETDSEVVVHLL